MMTEEGFSVGDIQDAEYSAESQRDLQELPDNLYQEARAYIRGLDAERRRESAEKALQSLAEARYEKLRERVTLGVSVDERMLADEETKIYEKLQDGGVDAETAVSMLTETEVRYESPDMRFTIDERPEKLKRLREAGLSDSRAREVLDQEEKEEETRSWYQIPKEQVYSDSIEVDRVEVRILEDLPEIKGTDDRVYDLAEEDVVALPKPNAEALLTQDAAQRVYPVNDEDEPEMSDTLAQAMGASGD